MAYGNDLATSISVEGLDELDKQLKKLSECLPPGEVEPLLLEGARVIASEAQCRAPVGPTGNLKGAFVTKTMTRNGENPAPAIAAVDRKKAPHGHLVEYGSGPRYTKTKGRKGVFTMKYTGRMPANPFMRPAFDGNKRQVAQNLVEQMEKKIAEAAR